MCKVQASKLVYLTTIKVHVYIIVYLHCPHTPLEAYACMLPKVQARYQHNSKMDVYFSSLLLFNFLERERERDKLKMFLLVYHAMMQVDSSVCLSAT